MRIKSKRRSDRWELRFRLLLQMCNGSLGRWRVNLSSLVKLVLRKYGYPPDKQEVATQTVIQQAELMAGEWV